MSYYINPVEEDHCLFLCFEAKVPAVEAEAVRHGVKALLGDKRWNRIVLDATQLQSNPTTLELFAFFESLCLDLPHDAWIALVARPDQARYCPVSGEYRPQSRCDANLLYRCRKCQ